MLKKVLIIHYLTGERDGVSLEIEKRIRILKELGAEVKLITGQDGLDRDEAFIIPEFDIKSSLNIFLRENFFFSKMLDEQMIIALYHNLENQVYNQLDQIFKSYSPDIIFVHNVLSMPLALPATTALVKVMDKYQIPSVAIHHDFWFEREAFLKPNYLFIKEILKLLPPNRTYFVKHQVINSLVVEELHTRRKITPEQIGDFWDYSQPAITEDDYNNDLKEEFHIGENDIVVLQATRILKRKAIENAIRYVQLLEKDLRSQAPIQIGKKLFSKDSKVFLLFSNFVEADSVEYYKELRLLAEQLRVNTIWGSERFHYKRQQRDGLKIYNFWDSYLYADIVTYPSILEGFGNQLLEAIFFKKLPVLYEYDVFKKDIKKEGYNFISLGDTYKKETNFHLIPETTLQDAVKQTIALLKDSEKLKSLLENNFKLAQKYHDESILTEDLKKTINI